VTQEWYFLDPELTLAELGVQLMLSQTLKYNSEVIFMIFHTPDYTKMSSMNTMTNGSNSDMKTEFMRHMKCAGALVNPKDMTRYSLRAYLVVKAVLGISLARI
jgi:hypothetical protein